MWRFLLPAKSGSSKLLFFSFSVLASSVLLEVSLKRPGDPSSSTPVKDWGVSVGALHISVELVSCGFHCRHSGSALPPRTPDSNLEGFFLGLVRSLEYTGLLLFWKLSRRRRLGGRHSELDSPSAPLVLYGAPVSAMPVSPVLASFVSSPRDASSLCHSGVGI